MPLCVFHHSLKKPLGKLQGNSVSKDPKGPIPNLAQHLEEPQGTYETLQTCRFLRPCLLQGGDAIPEAFRCFTPYKSTNDFLSLQKCLDWKIESHFSGVIGGFFRINFPRLFAALKMTSCRPFPPKHPVPTNPSDVQDHKENSFPQLFVDYKTPPCHNLKKNGL